MRFPNSFPGGSCTPFVIIMLKAMQGRSQDTPFAAAVQWDMALKAPLFQRLPAKTALRLCD
jgi:hypothetical protein